MINTDKFTEPFTFRDIDGRLTERPLGEMIPIEALRAWHWHCHEADRICAQRKPPTAAEIAAVEKAQRLWDLIGAAMPEWPDGTPVGQAVHRFWPFGRAPN